MEPDGRVRYAHDGAEHVDRRGHRARERGPRGARSAAVGRGDGCRGPAARRTRPRPPPLPPPAAPSRRATSVRSGRTIRSPCPPSCAGAPAPARRARGRPGQGEPAAHAPPAAPRRGGRARGGVRRHVPHQRARVPARRRLPHGRARRHPVAAAVRDLLPHAERPVDPRARARGIRSAHPHRLRPARAAPAARALRQRRAARAPAGRRARLARLGARRAHRRRDRDGCRGPPLHRDEDDARPRGGAAHARRQHLPRAAVVAVGRGRRDRSRRRPSAGASRRGIRGSSCADRAPCAAAP